jgi:D-glycero-alpha-D-manno-heptose-7-phosphate kinase
MILSKTPVRIAFGGGGTDVEPYCSDYGGFVINSTINLYFRSILNIRKKGSIKIFSNDKFTAYRFDELDDLKPQNINGDIIRAIVYLLKPQSGMDIYLHGEPPKKAGLGASASLCSCLIGGIQHLEGKNLDKDFVAEQAYKVEQGILNNIGGRQDQYAAVYGGLNEIEFLNGSDVKINKLSVSNSFIKELEKRILLFYTGEPHTSGNIVGAQVKSYHENKAQAKKSLDILKNIAYQMKDAFLSEDFEQLGQLLSEDWKEKTRFNPLITIEYMKDLNEMVMKNGGIGGRVCGAGGGGCIFWLVEPKKREILTKILKGSVGQIIDFRFVEKGFEISNI